MKNRSEGFSVILLFIVLVLVSTAITGVLVITLKKPKTEVALKAFDPIILATKTPSPTPKATQISVSGYPTLPNTLTWTEVVGNAQELSPIALLVGEPVIGGKTAYVPLTGKEYKATSRVQDALSEFNTPNGPLTGWLTQKAISETIQLTQSGGDGPNGGSISYFKIENNTVRVFMSSYTSQKFPDIEYRVFMSDPLLLDIPSLEALLNK